MAGVTSSQSSYDVDNFDGVLGAEPSLDFSRTGEEVTKTLSHRGRRFVWSLADAEPSLDPASSWWLTYLRGGISYPGSIGSKTLSIVDLFSGAGGLSLGARIAAGQFGFGLRHLAAVDVDEHAAKVVANNFRSMPLGMSVNDLVSFRITRESGSPRFVFPPKLLTEQLLDYVGGVDLVVAGPPCQGNSTANNHTRFNDPRNSLYLTVPAVAVALEAKIVVIENVPGITAAKENVVSATRDLLISSGYGVTTAVVRADQLGWPQTRRRFFMVATLGYEPIDLSRLLNSVKQVTRPVSWALADILNSSENSFMTTSPKTTATNQSRMDYLHANDLFELPVSERPDCHQEGHTYNSVYGRMRWDEPAPTLTTGFMSPGRGRYTHPKIARTLLPREAARIQGFPDDYDFSVAGADPKRTELAKWIGDAVPAPMGWAAVLAGLLGSELLS